MEVVEQGEPHTGENPAVSITRTTVSSCHVRSCRGGSAFDDALIIVGPQRADVMDETSAQERVECPRAGSFPR
jgi:hypothetical protein